MSNPFPDGGPASEMTVLQAYKCAALTGLLANPDYDENASHSAITLQAGVLATHMLHNERERAKNTPSPPAST